MKYSEYGDSHLKHVTRFLYKYLWCWWIHHKHKCYPRDHKHWHCNKCHPCGEGFDILLKEKKFGWL